MVDGNKGKIMYYCKIKRGVVFTPSTTTIEWNDDRLKNYREYSANLSDKSKELSFNDDGIPIIKTLILDENGERYLIYKEDGTPDLELIEHQRIANELSTKIQEAKAYLNSTDWYYARKAETGEDVPAEVVEKRLASRKLIQEAK